MWQISHIRFDLAPQLCHGGENGCVAPKHDAVHILQSVRGAVLLFIYSTGWSRRASAPGQHGRFKTRYINKIY